MAHRIVGQPIGRLDGTDKVSGAARYSADVTLPGLVWGKALRSPLPHARILRIDTSRARALPGVLAVLTAADLPDILVGRRMFDMPVLARDRVRFIGEKIAVVAALDPDIAEEALALIDVEYEDLPAVFDPVEAIEPGAPLVHENPGAYEGAPSRAPARERPVGPPVQAGRRGGRDSARPTASSSTPSARSSRITGYLEPHAGVVALDGDDRVQVWASNKMPYRLKELLSHALQLPPARIRVNLTPIGGDFGGKGSLMDLPLAYHLARVTRRPVKMVMRYTEELMAGNPRHPSVITMRTGVTKDGRLVARRVTALFNSGAYAAFKPAPSVNLGGTSMGAGVYRIPNLLIEGFCVYTHNIPCGHARSPGEPQIVFAGESHMDMIAKELSLDPAEFRRRNLLRDGDVLPNGHHLEHVRASETLEAALEASEWSKPKAPWTGRGVAMTHRHIGVGFTNAHVRLETKGTVTLTIGAPRHRHGRASGAPAGRGRSARPRDRRSADRARHHRRLRDRFRRGRQPRHAHGRPRGLPRGREAQGADPGGSDEARHAGRLARHDRAGGRARREGARGVALLRCESPRRRHLVHRAGRRGRRRPGHGSGDRHVASRPRTTSAP